MTYIIRLDNGGTYATTDAPHAVAALATARQRCHPARPVAIQSHQATTSGEPLWVPVTALASISTQGLAEAIENVLCYLA